MTYCCCACSVAVVIIWIIAEYTRGAVQVNMSPVAQLVSKTVSEGEAGREARGVGCGGAQALRRE